jgi:lactoylglutathione lyase
LNFSSHQNLDFVLGPGTKTDFKPGTLESEKYLWSTPNTTIELTHNYGTESQDDFAVNNGNVEPHRGFGHIAFNTNDVEAVCKVLDANGVKFQKKPDEGRMKGLAFALDPDGYWLEIVKRSEECPKDWPTFNLSQTMLRVKDADKSVAYYKENFGLNSVRVSHYGDFSLYFMANEYPDENTLDGINMEDMNSTECREKVKQLWQPVLELTHNHDSSEVYHNGNDEPQGFGHIGFVVDDLQSFCDEMIKNGHPFKKKPEDGNMKNIAFALDPDGYAIEIIQSG